MALLYSPCPVASDKNTFNLFYLFTSMTNSMGKLVSKTEPLFLYEHLELFIGVGCGDLQPPDGAVVGVQEQHGQAGQLGGAVPPVTAVHQHRRLLVLHLHTRSSCNHYDDHNKFVMALLYNVIN